MSIVVVLIIIGYLFNDIVVVYDWICENFCKYKKKFFIELFDLLINEMLLWMIMIFVIMFLVLIVFYVFGGEVI